MVLCHFIHPDCAGAQHAPANNQITQEPITDPDALAKHS